MDYIATDGRHYVSVPNNGCNGCAFRDEDECARVDRDCWDTTYNKEIIWVPATAVAYRGEVAAKAVAVHLVGLSAKFTVTPLPNDVWEFDVSPDFAHLMPASNVDDVPRWDDTWRTNRGDMPVDKYTRVDVCHRNGDTYLEVEAGTGYAADWSIEDHPGDIMYWRLSKPQEN